MAEAGLFTLGVEEEFQIVDPTITGIKISYSANT